MLNRSAYRRIARAGLRMDFSASTGRGADSQKNLADGELTARQNALTVLQQQNTEFDKYIAKWDTLIQKLKAASTNPKN